MFAGGYEYNGTKYVAKYWKNGTPVVLTDGLQNAVVESIYIFDSEVYAGGYESNGTNNVGKYWKNGNPVSISDGSTISEINSVFVVGQ